MNDRELTEEDRVRIADEMAKRRHYSLKLIARRWQISTKTAYRIYQRVTRFGTPTTEPEHE